MSQSTVKVSLLNHHDTVMSGAPTKNIPICVLYKMIEWRTNHLEEDVVNKDIFNNMSALRILQGRQVFLKGGILIESKHT